MADTKILLYEQPDYAQEVYHHGVKGMRWGVRHDRKPSGRRNRQRDGTSGKSGHNKIFNKRNAKIALGAVGVVGAGALAYKLSKMNIKPSDFQKVRTLAGDATINDIGSDAVPKSHSDVTQNVDKGLKIHKRYMTEKERFATVCPKGRTYEYKNCCTAAGIAGYLAESLNIDCEALPTGRQQQMIESLVERGFKNIKNGDDFKKRCL